jgi:hypothetical protein
MDALVALVTLFFFFWGLIDGTVSAFNIGIWLILLTAVGGVVWGSLRLRSKGRLGPAVALAWVLAIPGFLLALFYLVLLVGHPRWN